MRLIESRRITGPHLLIDAAGAAVEAALEPDESVETAVAAWNNAVERGCRLLQWRAPRFGARVWDDGRGVSLAFTSPPDLLETACLIAEQAISGDFDEALLRDEADREERPRLRRCLDAGARRRWPHFVDDDGWTLGYGKHAKTWPLAEVPGDVPDGDSVARVPVALVTGTNGKTTTSRLLARMAREAGFVDGLTSSDAIAVGGASVVTGDWSGPGAARTLLRDERVTLAVLETARGGLLRRGVAVADADVAVVTNVSADHFGEYGIDSLGAMADAKLSIIKGLRPGGVLVYNAGCAPLVARLPEWTARRPDVRLEAFLDDGGPEIRLGTQAFRWTDAPITVGGLARYNVENALAAATAARVLGIPDDAIARALLAFSPTTSDSSGRTNLLHLHGATFLIDFAHNPDGLRNLSGLIRGLPATRRWMSIGQAGDRSDALIEETGQVAASYRCDRYVVKDLEAYRRGREPGAVAEHLRRGLLREGIRGSDIDEVTNDPDAARLAVAWVRPGDLVILLVHERLREVLEILEGAR